MLIRRVVGRLATDFAEKEKKIGQADCIAPLQPPVLAPFPAWGIGVGAGRARLAPRKDRKRPTFRCFAVKKQGKA